MGAVVSVDLTPECLKQARKLGYRLIVTHHPSIFPKSPGISKLASHEQSTLPGLLVQALSQKIAVAAYHTNFDRCSLEVVRKAAAGLKLEPRGRLVDPATDPLQKLAVFVPSSHLDSVRKAVVGAGAGQIGNYDSCTFSAPGEGTFRGGKGSRPFFGRPGGLEKASEYRLETIFPKGLARQVLSAMFEAHPYEEVAYDLIPVRQPAGMVGLVKGLGYGFWGEFPRAKSFSEVSRDVKSLFNIDGFWMTEPIPRRVRRVAFVAGKGGSFGSAAIQVGCDLLITGEAGYHTAMDQARLGLSVMEIGHRESEKFFLPTMAGWLSAVGLKAVQSSRPTQRLC